MFRFCSYLVVLLCIEPISTSYRSLIACSFESACALRQDQGDDFDWMEGRGRMKGDGMFAPSGDHTYGTSVGVYFFTPSDVTREGQSGKLVSEPMPLAANTTVSVDFVYHMFDEEGQDRLGSLRVYINDDMIWSRTRNQGPTWMRAIVNATSTSTSIQVTFEGILGGMHSDIGLDDVLIGIYETTSPDFTTEVTPEVTPCETDTQGSWKVVACVSLLLVGCMGICLVIAAVFVLKIRKKINMTKGSVPSNVHLESGSRNAAPKQCHAGEDPDGYLPLNAAIAKTADKGISSGTASAPQVERHGDLYLQPTLPQQARKTMPHTDRPCNLFLRSRKVSWNNDNKDNQDCDYECLASE
ncbi:MAM and LDL-receptor class A domain-containing protein 1-like [Acanthaster planci]|uniref:MAM and LDL-receptor class A domain-containing protein 1-like n=1 Tax=Acanthaster planci TaxID=133434 RepID=A0A8B7YX33_ACAPL|nr:MAM and LDL-receptor class A domain-containing protein 1-like [Acanthaster planci]